MSIAPNWPRLRLLGLATALFVVALPAGQATAEPSPSCDRPYIQAHLERVEQELLAADTGHLTEAQRERRAHHITTLATYRQRCEFPRHDLAPDRLVTVFVDDGGVHCAVGHLMALDGQEALVARIREDVNTATIQELAHNPELRVWLHESGLSDAEAARIQPGYCHMNFGGTCLCGRNEEQAVTAIAEAQIVALGPESFQVEARVTQVHGTGVAVDDIRIATRIEGDVVGRIILITIHEAQTVGGDEPNLDHATRRGPRILDGDQVSCTSGSMGSPSFCAQVPTDLYIDALLSEDCLAKLGEYDKDLTRSVCDLQGGECTAAGTPPPSQEDGCHGGSSDAGWWALAGLVCVVGSRRARALRTSP